MSDLKDRGESNAPKSTKDDAYLGVALDTKSQNTTKSMQVLLCVFMGRMVLQAGIRDPRYIFSSIKPLSQGKCVIQMALHSERQSFKTWLACDLDTPAFSSYIIDNTNLEATRRSQMDSGRHQCRATTQS